MNNKKLAKNTITSFLFQICTIICGFIVPRLILQTFGSEANGMVNSITQFLGVIAFLELGVGAVVISSLYKPLADNDDAQVSKIIVSAQKFFSKLAWLLLVYIVFLIIWYPLFAQQNFGFLYTSTMIIAIGIGSFAQYYFGIVNRLLLTADQRGYIVYTVQTIALLLNTIACIVLIKHGTTIHMVKLTTSLIYIARPIALSIYINRHYKINRHIQYEGEPIQQKWNGVAQHIAAVILDGTDIIVLTIFSGLSTVSIYSVYHLIIYGVKQLLLSMTNGIQALLGRLWAKQERDLLYKTFAWTEWLIHTGTTFIFGNTAFLILPFVQVYTNGINDTNYIQPAFAFLITAANAGHCLRLPYHIMIKASGRYKETQSNYIIAAALNVLISVAVVNLLGLAGVAIGTLIAMLYQTVWMAIYNSKNLLNWPIKHFVKQITVDGITVLLIYLLTRQFSLGNISYLSWVVLAIKVATVSVFVVVMVNLFFYKDKLMQMGVNIRKMLPLKVQV